MAARAEPVVDVGGEGEGEAGGVVGGGAQQTGLGRGTGDVVPRAVP